ncbi:MAG: hypothetical protein JW757_12595 [Anaerolineales bacterium]|nr:hypothetical protein [Anaerolineales bacterium]
MPKSNLGKWSVGLILVMLILLFIGTSLPDLLYKSVPAGSTLLEDISQRPALALTMLAGFAAGVSSFITGLIAIIKQKDRRVLVLVSTLVGAAPIIYIIGEILSAR